MLSAVARVRHQLLRPALAQAGASRGMCKALPTGVVVDNNDMATGMEKKEIDRTADIFWSREPLMGHKGTKENPAIIPSFNTSRCVGLETEQGVIWFRIEKGPLHLVADQYFKLEQIQGGDH